MHGLRVAGVLLLMFGVVGGFPTGSGGIIEAIDEGSIGYLVVTVTIAATGLYALVASFSGSKSS